MKDVKITIGCVINKYYYNEDELKSYIKNIQTYVGQVNTLYIYNKTSRDISELLEKFTQYPYVRVADVDNYSEIDIYREIANRAKEDGSTYFTMLYQGYYYEDESFVSMKRYLLESDVEKIAVFTPMPLFGCDTFERKAEEYRYIKGCRLMGALVNTEIYFKTEGFDSSYYQTTYDYDYCLDVRHKGYLVMLSQNDVLRNLDYHVITKKIFFYAHTSMIEKDTMDVYYEARGRRYLWDKYKYIDPDYVKLDKKLAKKEKREIWAKDKNRKEKMQMYDKAFDDYRRGRKGIYKD